MLCCGLRLQLLASVIAVLNNLVSDEDVRLTVLTQLSAQKGDFQVGQRRARIFAGFAHVCKLDGSGSPTVSQHLMLVQATKERLLQCISLVGLPDRSQRAARFVLTRLDRRPKDAARSSLQCCAPLPPRLQPAFYDIWAVTGARGGA